jgi:hypothetical protein
MANPVHITPNGTRVLDPGTDNATMIVLYRGLGIEAGKAYAYDTAEWLIAQVKKAVSQSVLDRMILVAPFDYNQDCEHCIQQATKLIDKRGGNITSYSLCGFSRGGQPLYKNISRRNWKILGIIDAVTPTMYGYDDDIVDDSASRIRCIYGVSHWGSPPKVTPPPNHKKTGYEKIVDFHDHLADLGVKMTDATAQQGHSDMPKVFFENYGSDFV